MFKMRAILTNFFHAGDNAEEELQITNTKTQIDFTTTIVGPYRTYQNNF